MNRAIKVLKTIRNNWKKSLFGSVLLVYGGSWARNRYKLEQLMRCYCEEARSLGQAPAVGDAELPKVTVILNPVAGKSKSRKNFEKWCAPLLYTAGLQVSIVKCESEGHGRTLAESLQPTDAVIVAGGDGTLCETVTGLLRRGEGQYASEIPPVGILPLGKRNNTYAYLHGDKVAEDPSMPDHPAVSMANATMNVIRGIYRPFNVLKVQNEASERAVYSMRGIQWGAMRDACEREHKYWYWGSLKSYVTYVAAALRGRMEPREVEVSYRLPCEGCSTCLESVPYPESVPSPGPTSQSFVSRLLHSLAVKPPTPSVGVVQEIINNPECEQWKNQKVNTTEIEVHTAQNTSPPQCCLNIGPGEVDRRTFVSEGWKQVKKEASSFFETLNAQEVKLDFPEEKDGEPLWMSIDGDEYESRPLTARILRNKIRMFVSSNNKVL